MIISILIISITLIQIMALLLVQNPTARFQDAGTLAFSWSHREPYLNGSPLLPFEWLEASSSIPI